MAGVSDTSPEAARVLADALRAMPFDRKWRQMGEIYDLAKALRARRVGGEARRRP